MPSTEFGRACCALLFVGRSYSQEERYLKCMLGFAPAIEAAQTQQFPRNDCAEETRHLSSRTRPKYVLAVTENAT
jgi:hypothetical protein